MSEYDTAAMIAQLECLRDEIEAGNYADAIAWLEAAIKLLKKSLQSV